MGYVQRPLCFSAHHQTNEAPKLQQRAKLRLGLGNPASPLVLTTRHSVSVCNTLLLLFLKSASDVSGVELLRLEYMKAHRNAYGERMTEAQERQLERRLTKLCQMD